jgi:hypothetical protein
LDDEPPQIGDRNYDKNSKREGVTPKIGKSRKDDSLAQERGIKSRIDYKAHESDNSDDRSPPRLTVKSKVGGRIQSKIGLGKGEEATSPRKPIKSRIGMSKRSRSNSPHESQDDEKEAQVKQEVKPDTPVVVKELTAEEKALEKRMKLRGELEEKKTKEMKKVRKF